MKKVWTELIKLTKQCVKPALGCTEPVSVALAGAIARQYLGTIPENVDVTLSPNLFKNCMGVMVPGTGMAGAEIAAAIGIFAGYAEGGLEVLKNISVDDVKQAKHMLAEKKVHISISHERSEVLYVSLTASAKQQSVTVIIKDDHTNVVKIIANNKIIVEQSEHTVSRDNIAFDINNLTFKDIFDFAINVPFSDIDFILQAKALNDQLSKEGLSNSYGMQIGKSLKMQQENGLLEQGLLNNIVIRSCSASDARMGGAQLPAMSNSGSGNQGIAATMPVVVVAEKFAPNDEEKLARALILSHLSAIYIHGKLPTLSAFCAVSSASMGAATAIAWLMTGKYDIAAKSVSNMIGDISGIFCDGASSSCALKISTAVSAAYKAVLLAMSECTVSENDGIVAKDVEETINNLCFIASNGMLETDHLIIKTMYEKSKKEAV